MTTTGSGISYAQMAADPWEERKGITVPETRGGLELSPFFGLLAHCAVNPPTSSSLADDEACLLASPQHGGARLPTLPALG